MYKKILITLYYFFLISLTYLFLFPLPKLFCDIRYFFSEGQQNTMSISEPAIMFFLGSGLLGLGIIVKKRIKTKTKN